MFDDIEITEGPKFTPELHPAGIFRSALVDIVNEGKKKNPFYKPETDKPSKEYTDNIVWVWETEARRSDGSPFYVLEYFTKNLSDGTRGKESNLHKRLAGLLGADFDGRFSARQVADMTATLVIGHKLKADKKTKKHEVQNALPYSGDNPYIPAGTYKRFIKTADEATHEDDEVPF